MYSLITTSDFDKAFRKLDRPVQIMISKWIHKHLDNCDDPRAFGKGLSGNLKGWWRYRIGNYRLLVEIKDEELVIVAIEISHRSQVYQ
ncbi:MAG: type II toxin-antitoxin system RelE/ParE family toxin [Firmicutes bacterium]|nr:type II toxin-antitoxin system RelE/ParE family toxin [Bacillota bacterium]